MDYQQVVESRHSCRSFSDAPVTADQVAQIAALAAKAPSWGNTQPWKLTAVGGDKAQEIRRRLVEAFRQVMEEENNFEETDEKCEKCGSPMVKRVGRFGPFLSCSAYPKCKNIKSIEIKTGVKCPKCGGDIIERHSKRGKKFYGCSGYPKCDFALWNIPTGEKCPKCESLMIRKPNGEEECSNKECA